MVIKAKQPGQSAVAGVFSGNMYSKAVVGAVSNNK
jgi:hypothetical protein